MKTRIVNVKITHDDGTIVFQKDGFEIPSFWSDRAATIVASKYAMDNEYSAIDIIDRVVNQITEWGMQQGYFTDYPSDGLAVIRNSDLEKFSDDLKDILINQRAAFNSPVWFNCGSNTGTNQMSACFVLPVEDTMESILNHYTVEGMIFRGGSGAGINVSKLRAKGEKLSNKGESSGPVSFMKGWDSNAGTIKSGGKVRRAAKMVCMNVDHPDIMDFIECKKIEEDKAKLIIAGKIKEQIPKGMPEKVFRKTKEFAAIADEAYSTVAFQNTNHSIRVEDNFMKAIETGRTWKLKERKHPENTTEVMASDLLRRAAEIAWHTGDPGIQYDDEMNRANPIPNTDRINSTNPCQPRWATVLTKNGIATFDDIDVGSIIWSGEKWTKVTHKVTTGVKQVNEYITTAGSFVGTEQHKVFENGERVEVKDAETIDICLFKDFNKTDVLLDEQDIVDGWVFGDGCTPKASNNLVCLNMDDNDYEIFIAKYGQFYKKERYKLSNFAHEVNTTITAGDLGKTYERIVPHRFLTGNPEKVRGFLKGLYNANGSVTGGRVTLKAASFAVISDVQKMLSSLGIRSYFTTNKSKVVKFDNGEYICKENYDLNITRDKNRFAELIGFDHSYKIDKLKKLLNKKKSCKPPKETYEIIKIIEHDKEPVYDIRVEAEEHSYWTGGVLVSNCSEFSAVDNSSCNLASLNLLKYWVKEDEAWNDLQFEDDIKVLITAMDILIDAADYPTEAIREMTVKTRPLGLGFANLGALLMTMGMSYDSEPARKWAASITKQMTTTAYKQSIELAKRLGPFAEFGKNKHECAVVAANISQEPGMLEAVEKDGVRNSQVTLLAPTGCLSGETLILSDQGIIPIEDYGDKNGKEWQDIKINIPQESGIYNSNKYYINGKEKVLKITSSRGHEIECTEKHKFRVIDKDGNYIWKKAKDLESSDLLTFRLGGHSELLKDKNFITIENPTKQTKEGFKIDEEVARILGYYMGDGYIKEKGGVHFVIDKKDKDLIKIFESWANRTGTDITTEDRVGCFVANNNSRSTYKWFINNKLAKEKGNYGEGSASAFIPEQILKSKTSVLCAFLSGLFEADGTISFKGKTESPTIELTTVSKNLAKQVMIAMESLAIPITLKIQEPRENTKGNRIKYRVRITSLDGVYRFYEKINFLSERKSKRLKDWLVSWMPSEQPFVSGNNTSRHLSVRSQALIDNFYEASLSLPNNIRQDISTRKQQGMFNLFWARDLIIKNPQLKESKIQNILNLAQCGNLQFVPVSSITENGIKKTYDISVPEKNTYIANGFVTHNTISFMMDCDTTGIEPLFSLQTIKTFAGGGTMLIDYPCVQEAWKIHGYAVDIDAGDSVLEEIEKTDDEDLHNLFKTSNEIHWKGHIDMMAACQKHLNGAISKTVNMNKDATVNDVEDAYIYGWKSGLKCLAIYRDGSKDLQPMMSSTEIEDETLEDDSLDGWSALRRKLPETRSSVTHKFNVGGLEGYLTVGMYEDGNPGEIFIRTQKQGSTMQGVLDAFATAVSLALQYGVPIATMIDKFVGSKFEPAGFTPNEDIRFTSSVMDYIFRWLQMNFIDEEDESLYEIETPATASINPPPPAEAKYDGPPCPNCGSVTSRSGTCYICTQCGETTGCS